MEDSPSAFAADRLPHTPKISFHLDCLDRFVQNEKDLSDKCSDVLKKLKVSSI